MKTIYVYGLQDPRTNEIRYIGKTSKLRTRLEMHLKDTVSNRGKAGWIAELAAAGMQPKMIVLQTCDEQTWRDAEINWIAKARAEGLPILNRTDGGEEGGPGHHNLWFFREYVTPDLWPRFIRLSYREQLGVLTVAAQEAIKAWRAESRGAAYPVACAAANRALAQLANE